MRTVPAPTTMTSASSRSRLKTNRSPGPPIVPLLPPAVAPPSTLVMKLARTHGPVALGIVVEPGEFAVVEFAYRSEQRQRRLARRGRAWG